MLDPLLHDVIHLAAAEGDGMSRSSIGSGRHGRNVGAFEDEESRRRRATAAGRDIDNHRHGRGHNLLNNFTRSIEQPAGSIDLDEQGLVFVAIRFGDGAGNVFGCDGMDRIIDHNL